jgi:hypothetical protein
MINGNGHHQPAPPPAIDGRTEVAVTLQVNTWNLVLTLIAKAPWEAADPLIQEIRRQITVTLDPAALAASDPARPLA